jgi:hypothetical protein
MTESRLSRLGALSGAAFVVLELAGAGIAAAAGRPALTLADPDAKIVRAYHDAVGGGVWAGAFLEIASLGAFAVFAAWLAARRPGLPAIAALLAAAAFIAVTLTSLVVGDVLAYRAGHGLGAPATLALFDLQEGLFFTSWGIAAAFLALVPTTGWVRRTALAIAVLLLAGMAAPKAGVAGFALLLFFVWTLGASIALARRPGAATSAAPATAAI